MLDLLPVALKRALFLKRRAVVQIVAFEALLLGILERQHLFLPQLLDFVIRRVPRRRSPRPCALLPGPWQFSHPTSISSGVLSRLMNPDSYGKYFCGFQPTTWQLRHSGSKLRGILLPLGRMLQRGIGV